MGAFITDLSYRVPGIHSLDMTVVGEVTWGDWEYNKAFLQWVRIAADSVDQGHTDNTNLLRPGLLMGMDPTLIATTKLVRPWQTGDVFFGPLLMPVDVHDVNRYLAPLIIGGKVKSKMLILDAASSVPGGWRDNGGVEAAIRTQMQWGVNAAYIGRFMLDDWYVG